MARLDTTAVLAEMPLRQMASQALTETSAVTALPLMEKYALVIVLDASSGRTVACKSKRWPGKNRAITGAALPLLNISLGGVRRVTVGAAKAWVAHKAASPSADIQSLDGWFDNFIDKLSRGLKRERELMLVFQ
jgi:hypothetical protein